MVTLIAQSRYANRDRVYNTGDRFAVDERTAAWLEADSPGVFKRVDAPPVNKMMTSAPVDKAHEEREEIASEPPAATVEEQADSVDWTKVKGVSTEISNALHYMGLSTKDKLLAYFMENGISALTDIPGIGMKRARDIVAFAQEG